MQPDYKENAISRSLNALGLLASGDPQYLPIIKKEAEWAADDSADGFAVWWYGYVSVFLAEYVMATGDTSVLPGLRRIAMEAARGQSRVGSWGHRFAGPDGRLFGYGTFTAYDDISPDTLIELLGSWSPITCDCRNPCLDMRIAGCILSLNQPKPKSCFALSLSSHVCPCLALRKQPGPPDSHPSQGIRCSRGFPAQPRLPLSRRCRNLHAGRQSHGGDAIDVK